MLVQDPKGKKRGLAPSSGAAWDVPPQPPPPPLWPPPPALSAAPTASRAENPPGPVSPGEARLELTLELLRELEGRMALPAAAALLGTSPADLRRACRSLGVARWSHRAAAAAQAAMSEPETRAMAYVAILRRRLNRPAP